MQKFEISVVLRIPNNLKELTLENKYDDIEIGEEFPGDLNINLYSGKLKTKGIGGDLELTMKYSEASTEKAGKAKLDIYDSNLWLGELTALEVDSKYSEFEIDGVKGDVEIDAYDDKWEVGQVTGKMRINDKYSEFEFASIGDLEADIYDAEMIVESAKIVEIDESKYSEYKFGSVTSLRFDESYDDDVRVKTADELLVENSKYTEYRVDKLTSAFRLMILMTTRLNWIGSPPNSAKFTSMGNTRKWMWRLKKEVSSR